MIPSLGAYPRQYGAGLLLEVDSRSPLSLGLSRRPKKAAPYERTRYQSRSRLAACATAAARDETPSLP